MCPGSRRQSSWRRWEICLLQRLRVRLFPVTAVMCLRWAPLITLGTAPLHVPVVSLPPVIRRNCRASCPCDFQSRQTASLHILLVMRETRPVRDHWLPVWVWLDTADVRSGAWIYYHLLTAKSLQTPRRRPVEDIFEPQTQPKHVGSGSAYILLSNLLRQSHNGSLVHR